MPFVLTEADQIKCPHGSPITLAGGGSTRLKVAGQGVLLEAKDSAWVFTCAPPAPAKKCTKVASLAAKTAKLKVQNSAVLIDPAPAPTIGLTDGTPPGPIAASASQKVLSAA